MINKFDLSIILPCYNEASILIESLNEIINTLNQTVYSYEIIFIDDNSKDETQRIIKKIANTKNNIRWIFHQKNTGRGSAVVDGLRIAKGNIIGFIDVDLEIHARYIPSMVVAIKEEGFDMASAYRIYKLSLRSLARHLASISYRWLVKSLIKLPLKDTEAGFKFFRKENILPLLDKAKDKRWFWDTEISYFAYSNNLKIKEIPCLFIRRKDKPSSVKILKDSIDYLRKLLSFYRNSR